MKVALLLPGYLDSPEYLHMRIFEKRLKELGYEVEAIDPCNLWETGKIEEYSITNFLKQIEDSVSKYKAIGADEIVLIGHSLGGMVSIMAGNRISEVTKVVALCPPKSITDSVHKWDKGGVRTSKRDLPEESGKSREFDVPYSYIEDASKYSAIDDVKELHKPLMILIALEDTTVLPEITETIVNNANDPHVARLPNMGHDFRRSQSQSNLVMDEIEKFLEG